MLYKSSFRWWVRILFSRVAFRREGQVVSARSCSILHFNTILCKAKVLGTVNGSGCWRLVANENLAFRNWKETKTDVRFCLSPQ